MDFLEQEIKKILVINLAFIGDVILSTPVTHALRQAYPQAELVMLTTPVAADVAALNPYVSRVRVYDKKGQHKGLTGALDVVGTLRKEKFDLAICMNFALRGALIAWAAGIKYRVGYDAQHAGWFLTHTASAVRERIQHETMNHLQVLDPLDIHTEDTSLCFQMDAKTEEIVQATLEIADGRPIVIICPYGSYLRKSLSKEKYVQIIERIKMSANVFLVGGAKEKSDLMEIADHSGLTPKQVFAGTMNLKELAVLIRCADVVLSVDTGPMHMAQAIGTPVIALFGPTDPMVWGPRGNKDTLFYLKKPCAPCWGKGKCLRNDCMEDIDPAQVSAKIEEMIGCADERTST